MSSSELCSHEGCAAPLPKRPFSSASVGCHHCSKAHCASHQVDRAHFSHLSLTPVASYTCHACVEDLGYADRVWTRCLKDVLCAYRTGERYCPDGAEEACTSCGKRFCKAHTRSVQGLDSHQKAEIVKYPLATKLCVDCHRAVLLEPGSIVFSSVNKVIEEVDFRLGRQIDGLEATISRVASDAALQAKEVTGDAVRKLHGFVDSARDEANAYVTRLALAGLGFMMVYLLAPNLRRMVVLTLVQQAVTVGGLLIAGIGLLNWLRYSYSREQTRRNTVLLVGGGVVVLAVRFFVEGFK